MPHLKRPVAFTRLGMVAERVTRAFWPFWSVAFAAIAPLMFGWQDVAPLEIVWGLTVLAALALIATFVWGIGKYRSPTRAEAKARVDARLPGRPIAALEDEQAIGTGDAASEAVWKAHVARMEARTKDARIVEPDLRVSDRDPYGLRFIALLFFVCAMLFGSILRVNSMTDLGGGNQQLATGPTWEGWVNPPAYTGKPTLYLNDIPEGPLRVPAGSEITLRLYGEVGALTVAETVSARVGEVAPASDAQQEFTVTQSGRLAIEGENGAAWDVTLVEDQPPEIELSGPIETDAFGEMSQPFSAYDDYGIQSGTATIALDLAAIDRRHGLTVDPEGFEPLVLDLPMPFTGDRADFDEFLIENLSEHPLANLPVTLTLHVMDEAGQEGSSASEPMNLPGRRFFQPFAKAIIEQRRDLMWSKENAPRIAMLLKAVAHRPEGQFSNEVTFLRLRQITRRLDLFNETGITDEQRDELVLALWDLAIQLEDGTLADARERLRRAQERLEEAMRDGASDEEIAELMQELQEATDDYLQLLADQMEPEDGDGTDEPQSAENGQSIDGDQLQAMRDRIQELMEEGRMAEAMALMEQYNELLENLRITQGDGSGEGGPRTPGQQSMEDLADTLEDQQDLADDSFRDLQEQTNPGQQQGQQQQGGQQGQQGEQQGQQGEGQQGQQGQNGGQSGQEGQQGQGQGVGEDGTAGGRGDQGSGGEGAGSAEDGLAERQQALREELNRQRNGLGSLEGEAGDIARRSLERAEGAMDGAEQALRNGDLAEAIDQQSEALDALRNGMRSLSQALAENELNEEGQGSEQGNATTRVQPENRDPLGRQLGQNGQAGTEQNMLSDEDINRRAEELLGEIRRRSAEQERPEIERDYLRRLLDRF